MPRVTGLGHVGIYVRDLERMVRTEVLWLTGRPSWVPVANPIDIDQPEEKVLAEVDRLGNQVRHVPVGGTMIDEPATIEIAHSSAAPYALQGRRPWR